MASTGQLGFGIPSQGPVWAFETTYGELVPTVGGGNTTVDRYRGFGTQDYRFLVGEKAPRGTIFWTAGDGDAATAAAKTSLLASMTTKQGPLSTYPNYTDIPAGWLNKVGKVVWFRSRGVMDNPANPATVSGQITFNLLYGAGPAVVVVGTAMTAMTRIVSGPVPWFFNGRFTTLTTGGSGTVLGQGQFTYWTADNLTVKRWAAYQAAQTVDLTKAQTMDLAFEWSATDDSATITCEQLLVGFEN